MDERVKKKKMKEIRKVIVMVLRRYRDIVKILWMLCYFWRTQHVADVARKTRGNIFETC